MGGIPTRYTGEVITVDPQGGEKVVPGLYAAGEAACVSVHGANRLGANSLLDIVVFGRACAHHIKETLKPGEPHKPVSADLGAESIANLDRLRQASGSEPTAKIRLDMQKAMQTYDPLIPALSFLLGGWWTNGSDVAVFRTQESLQDGVKKINEVDKRFEHVGIRDRSMIWNTDLVETLELQNLLTCATVSPHPV
jgi:succinate dehydrogenase (ubiquinone) flavoprotein subunit